MSVSKFLWPSQSPELPQWSVNTSSVGFLGKVPVHTTTYSVEKSLTDCPQAASAYIRALAHTLIFSLWMPELEIAWNRVALQLISAVSCWMIFCTSSTALETRSCRRSTCQFQERHFVLQVMAASGGKQTIKASANICACAALGIKLTVPLSVTTNLPWETELVNTEGPILETAEH